MIAYDFTKGTIVVKGIVPSVPEDEKLRNLARKRLDPHFSSRFMIVVAGATGMRFAELLGLTWDHVDLEKGVIEIVRA